MKRIWVFFLGLALWIAAPTNRALAANLATPPDQPPALSVDQLREQILRLAPEQRQELLRSVRPDFGNPGGPGNVGDPNRNPRRAARGGAAFPPGPGGAGTPGAGPGFQPGPGSPGGPGPGPLAQRPAVMAQLAQIANLPPEQREVRMRQMHERVQNRVQELRKQQEAGPLAPQEQRQLENLQAVNTRLEELSRLSPEERDARLSALREMAARNGNGPRQGGPGFGRGPGGRGFGPGPDGLNQNQQRRPFPPVEGDPNNLPPKPAASDTPARTQQNS